MRKREELAHYKAALKTYKKGLTASFKEQADMCIATGFCMFFLSRGVRVYGDGMAEKLPVLASLAPPEENWVTGFDYWFPQGELEPRIALLERAIEIMQSEQKK